MSVKVAADGVEITTPTMFVRLLWASASLFVVSEDFAVLLAPRLAPLPITPAGWATKEAFFTFIRHAQQYKANSEG